LPDVLHVYGSCCAHLRLETLSEAVFFAGEAQPSACIFVAARFLNPVKACRNAALPDFLL